MKYLGVDYGKKRIGLAISDSGGQFAAAYGIVENEKGTFDAIGKIVEKEGVQAIVLGHSVDYAGKDNAIQEQINRFADLITTHWKLPVSFSTEVFSSMQAKWGVAKPVRRSQKKDRISNKVSATDPIDHGAAVIILQSYLDKKRNS